MKLQSLAIIFIIIMLPVTLIISAYTQSQIDTLALQNQYDTKLLNATYDAAKAFQINSLNNRVSTIADTLRQDINASVSTFMTSLSISSGVGGYSKNFMREYVPALLFTLYDGYYIYSPTIIEGKQEYVLKPYNYYTVRYVYGNIDVVVNYTLDNYIAVYGWIGNEYVTRAGYLVSNYKDVSDTETLYEYLPKVMLNDEGRVDDGQGISGYAYDPNNPIVITDKEKYSGEIPVTEDSNPEDKYRLYPNNEAYYVDPESAKKYYEEALEFTKWVEDNLGKIPASAAVRTGNKLSEFKNDTNVFIFRFNTSDNDPESKGSIFSDHKRRVIRSSIQDNLNEAITSYNRTANNTTYDFGLPILKEDEWDMILSNVCVVSFLQGMPLGNSYYNNYAIVTNSTNNQYVGKDDLYFVSTGGDGCYHKIDCPELKGTNITGYKKLDFEKQSVEINKETWYFRRHQEKACYYCIVDGNYESKIGRDEATDELLIDSPSVPIEKKTAYYTALAREKYRLYKATKDLEVAR